MLVSIVDLNGRHLRDVRPQLNQLGDTTVWDRGSSSFIAIGTDLKDRRGIFRIALESGAATRLFDVENVQLSGLTASPRDPLVLFRRVTAAAVSIVAKDLQSGAERELVSRPRAAGMSDVIMRPFLSPDGRRVATVTRDAKGDHAIITTTVESGQTEEVIPASPDGLAILMWAPDSHSMVVRRTTSKGRLELVRVPVAGGPVTRLNWTFGADAREFRVHPDGQRLVYVVDSAPAKTDVRALTNVLAGANANKRE